MFKPGNEWMIEEFQKEVDKRWQELLDLEEITNRKNGRIEKGMRSLITLFILFYFKQHAI